MVVEERTNGDGIDGFPRIYICHAEDGRLSDGDVPGAGNRVNS